MTVEEWEAWIVDQGATRKAIIHALRAAAAEARREMGEEAAEAVESYEKWHGVNLTTLAHVIREVAKDPEAPASSPSATRPEDPTSTWTGPRGEQVVSADWSCAKCGHNHVGALGGICVGCSCTETHAATRPEGEKENGR